VASLFDLLRMGAQHGGQGGQRGPYPVVNPDQGGFPGFAGHWGPSPANQRLLRGDVHVVGQADPRALEAYRSTFGVNPAQAARMSGRLPPARRPLPVMRELPQHFGNDWGGMQRAVGLQQAMNYGGAGMGSLASLLGLLGGR
jgi:hypothetical protein